MKHISIVLIAAILICSEAYAGGSTSYGKITEMYTSWDWTMVTVPNITNHSSVNSNPDNCKDNTNFAIEPEHKNYQTMHAVLMAAQMAGKDVRFYLSGCAGQNGAFPRIISIWSK